MSDPVSSRVRSMPDDPDPAKYLPKDGMIQMTAAVKSNRLLKANCRLEVVLHHRFGELLLGDIEIVDVSGVMLLMMQAHDFGANCRLERIVVVRHVGQRVLGAYRRRRCVFRALPIDGGEKCSASACGE